MNCGESRNTEISYFNEICYRVADYKLNYRACIPLYVLLDPTLSANEIRLYGLIEQMETTLKDVYITDRTLAYILGVKFESKMIQKMSRKLKSKSYIKREEKEVYLNKRIQFLKCWSTVKPGNILISESSGELSTEGVPPVPPENKNNTGGVPVVPTPCVPEVHPPRVPEVHTLNTQERNTHEKKKNTHRDNDACVFFDSFWNLYPHHNRASEKTCRSIWVNRQLDSIASTIIEAVQVFLASDRHWLAGYSPSAKTFLREDRWTHEPVLDKKTKEEREAKQQAEQQRIENEKRQAEQAKYSEERYQRQKEEQYKQDAQAFRAITKGVSQGIDPKAKAGLNGLLAALGAKSKYTETIE